MATVLDIQPVIPGEVAIWDRQPGEGNKPYHAFCHYRDLGVNRTLTWAVIQHLRACMGRPVDDAPLSPYQTHKWSEYSAKYGWVARVQAWDAAQANLVRDQLAADHRETMVRHARLAQGALTALSAPVRACLEMLKDPQVLANLVAEGKASPAKTLAMVTAVGWAARNIPALIAIERQALGIVTAVPKDLDGEDGDLIQEMDVARRITSDPVSVDLLTQVYDRLAGTGSVAPHGLGPSDESGSIEDGATPEPDRDAPR